MANVIVSTFTNLPGGVLDSFRQGFIDALVKEGNSVLVFKTNQFLKDYNASNVLASDIDQRQLIAVIKDFKPDLFISVNHSGLFPGLAEAIECPIGIWLLDGPGYLIDPEECRRQASRYHMFIATRAFREDLKLSFGMSDSHIHDLPLASDFRGHDSELLHNIAFIGTNFTGIRLQEIIKKHNFNRTLISKIRALINSYMNDRDMVFPARLKNYGLENVFVGEFDEAYILNMISINSRIKVLDAIEDLGLALYGTPDWLDVMTYSVGLGLCFDPRPVLTKSDLESIYNASKVNINISHYQARGGLPWRVFDVMCCNGALVSDYQEDLSRLFGKDIGIPIYQNPREAREICELLLKDEAHRRFIVESCQQAIESGHRFKHRLNTISGIFDIDLLSQKPGKLTKLDAQDFYHESKYKSRLSEISLRDNAIASAIATKHKQFPLQLFQSNILTFTPNNNILANINISKNNEITCEFELCGSLPFLRLDIGEYFSQHKNVKITISPVSQSSRNGHDAHVIDLSEDIIESNEFSWCNGELTCGFDSFCVFENPFPKKDIKLYFESILKTSIHETNSFKALMAQFLPIPLMPKPHNELLSQFLACLNISDVSGIEIDNLLKDYLSPSDFNLFIDLIAEIESRSRTVDTLDDIHPILTDRGTVDLERFTNLLYQIATINSNGNQSQHRALSPKIKAKLLYYRLNSKLNSLLKYRE